MLRHQTHKRGIRITYTHVGETQVHARASELQQVALGAKGSVKGVVTTYGDMLLFYVPSVGQDNRVRLLGWQTGLLKVKSL